MKSLVVFGAAALMVAALTSDAFAQKRGFGGGGGFSRGAFGGGSFSRGSFGGFNRAAIGGGGFRGARVSGARFANVGGLSGGSAWSGRRVAWGGHRWHRRGFGWGVPVAAAGLAFAAASTYPYYSDSCLRWNGWEWVNVCYSSYGYDYGPGPYPYTGYGPYPYW